MCKACRGVDVTGCQNPQLEDEQVQLNTHARRFLQRSHACSGRINPDPDTELREAIIHSLSVFLEVATHIIGETAALRSRSATILHLSPDKLLKR
jgi:hypothetical protein